MTSWSYSAFSTASQCLARYKYVFIDKLVSEEPASGDMEFGTALHMAMEMLLTGNDLDTTVNTFHLYWNELKPDNYQWTRFNHAQLQEMGETFIGRFHRLHLKNFDPQTLETRFYADYKGTKFEGTPDFIGLYKGERTLFDWKTSAYNYPAHKKDIALQLYLYAYLASQNNIPLPTHLGYLVFNKGMQSIQVMHFPLDVERMHLLLDNMKQYCDNFDSMKEYPMNPNSCTFGQNRCPFFSRCFGGK